MKLKLLSLVLALGSTFAAASQLPNPLLERQFRSGYVLPQYIRQSNCRVYPKVHPMYSASVVINEKTGPELTQQPQVKKPITWTAEVPNEGAIVKLIQEAKLEDGNKEKLLLPADVAATKHSAIETIGAGAPKYWVLRWQNSDAQGEENPSEAAKTLVKFLDENCN